MITKIWTHNDKYTWILHWASCLPIFQNIYNAPDFYTNINLYTDPFLTNKTKKKMT